MGKNTLLVEIEGRDKGALNLIKSLDKENKNTQKSFTKLNETMKLNGDNYGLLQSKLSQYASQLSNTQKKMKVYQEIISRNEKYLLNEKENLENVKKAHSDFLKQYRNTDVLKQNQKSLASLRQEKVKLNETEKKLKTEIASSKKVYDSLGVSIKANKDKLKELEAEGKKGTALYNTIKANLQNEKFTRESVKSTLDNQKKALKNLNVEMKSHSGKIKETLSSIKEKINVNRKFIESEKDISKGLEKQENKLREYKGALKECSLDLDLFNAKMKNANEEFQKDTLKKKTDEFKKLGDEMQKSADRTRHYADGFNAVGNALFKLSAPMLAIGTYGVKAFIDFEDAFAGVRKTVDASEPQFEQLQNTILSMSEKMPQSASNIATVMEMAGQLGVGVNDLEKFTETMIKLGDSTNVASDEAAKLLAQFTNVVGMDRKDIERLGSVIVDLGNNSATTEADIVSMMQSLSGIGKTYGIHAKEIAGIAATVSEVGIESEKGGTAITKFLIKMAGAGGKATEEFRRLAKESGMTEKEIQKAMRESGQSLQNFANLTGMTAEQFKKLAKDSPSEAIYQVMKALDGMQKEGKDVIPILETLGIKEVRLRDTVLRLAGAHKSLRKNLDISKRAWAENTALETEAQKRYETTASKLKILRNQFTNVAREIGVELLPTLLGLLEKAKDFLTWLKNMDSSTRQFLITFTKITLGVAALTKGIGTLLTLKSGIMSFFAVLQKNKAEGLFEVGKGAANVTEKITSMSASGSSAGGVLSKLGTSALGLNPAFLIATGGVTTLTLGFMAHNTHAKQMNQTILDTTDKMSTWDKVVAWAYGTTKKSNKELEEMGLKFSDVSKLSPQFASAVKKARDEVARLHLELDKTTKDNFLSAEESESIDKKVAEMVDNTVNILESRKSEIQEKYKEAFSKDGIFTEEEKKTVAYLTKERQININSVKNMQNEIKRIQDLAILEKRGLTEQEVRLIKEKVDKIKEIELGGLATTQKDVFYMKNKFVNEIGKVDLEGASKLIQEKRKLYDDEVTDIQARYDAEIEMLKLQGERLTGEKKIENDKAITLLEQARDKELAIANGKYDELIRLVKEKYPQIANEIDEWTGKILTTEEKNSKKSLEDYKIRWNLYKEHTKKGWQYVYDEQKKTHNLMYIDVDEATNKIVGVYDVSTNKIMAVNENHKQSLQKVQNEYKTTADKTNLAFLRMMTDITKGTKVNNSQLQAMALQLGFTKDATGNLSGSITDLNGNPIKVVINNKGEIISGLEQIKQAVYEIPRNWSVNISYSTSGNKPSHSSFARGDFASGTTYLKPYASGVKYLPKYAGGGYVTTRVNELGFELFDLPKNRNAFFLGTNRGDEIMNLPVGTEITNHIASTRKMYEAVKREVKRQISPLYRLQYANAGGGDKVIKQEVTVKFENVVIKDNRDITEIMEQMKYEIKKEVI